MSAPSEPGDRPRGTSSGPRLERAPGERYAPSPEPAPASAEHGSPAPGRSLQLAVGVAIAGAVAIVVLGGVLALTAGLLVVAAIVGWGVATTIRGGGDALAAPGQLAAGLATASVVLGQVGLWLYARSEGGALGPVEYLAQTWGLLVPAQLAVAAATAWWTARRRPPSPT